MGSVSLMLTGDTILQGLVLKSAFDVIGQRCQPYGTKGAAYGHSI